MKKYYDDNLTPHQKDSLAFLISRAQVPVPVVDACHFSTDTFPRGGCLFHQMGTMKSRPTFYFAHLNLEDLQDGEPWTPSLICAYNNCYNTWVEESNKFNKETGFKTSVYRITSKTTADDLRNSNATVFFITPSLLGSWYKKAQSAPWSCVFYRMCMSPMLKAGMGVVTYADLPDPNLDHPIHQSAGEGIAMTTEPHDVLFYDMAFRSLIVDEAQFLRNGAKTLNYIALRAIVTGCRICLTGTPYFKADSDIGNIVCFLGVPETWLMYGQTRDVMVSRLTSDDVEEHNPALSLPQIHTEVHALSFAHTEEAKLYAQYVKDTIRTAMRYISLRDDKLQGVAEAKMRHTGNVLAMRRVCMMPMCVLGQKNVEPWMREGCTKVQAILKIIRSRPGDNFVIVSRLVTPLRVLRDVLMHELTMDEEDVMMYTGDVSQRDREVLLKRARGDTPPRILLLSIGVGSTSLNLQNFNVMIFFSPDYVPGDVDQTVARIWRQGQKRETTVIHLVIDGTYESSIFCVCAARAIEMLMKSRNYRLAQVKLDPVWGFSVRDGASPEYLKIKGDSDASNILKALNGSMMDDASFFLQVATEFKSSNFEERRNEKRKHEECLRKQKRFFDEKMMALRMERGAFPVFQ